MKSIFDTDFISQYSESTSVAYCKHDCKTEMNKIWGDISFVYDSDCQLIIFLDEWLGKNKKYPVYTKKIAYTIIST